LSGRRRAARIHDADDTLAPARAVVDVPRHRLPILHVGATAGGAEQGVARFHRSSYHLRGGFRRWMRPRRARSAWRADAQAA
jgi:hypothetical protein